MFKVLGNFQIYTMANADANF